MKKVLKALIHLVLLIFILSCQKDKQDQTPVKKYFVRIKNAQYNVEESQKIGNKGLTSFDIIDNKIFTANRNNVLAIFDISKKFELLAIGQKNIRTKENSLLPSMVVAFRKDRDIKVITPAASVHKNKDFNGFLYIYRFDSGKLQLLNTVSINGLVFIGRLNNYLIIGQISNAFEWNKNFGKFPLSTIKITVNNFNNDKINRISEIRLASSSLILMNTVFAEDRLIVNTYDETPPDPGTVIVLKLNGTELEKLVDFDISGITSIWGYGKNSYTEGKVYFGRNFFNTDFYFINVKDKEFEIKQKILVPAELRFVHSINYKDSNSLIANDIAGKFYIF